MAPRGPSFGPPEFTETTDDQLAALQRQIEQGRINRKSELVNALDDKLQQMVALLDQLDASDPRRQRVLDEATHTIALIKAEEDGADTAQMYQDTGVQLAGLARRVQSTQGV